MTAFPHDVFNCCDDGQTCRMAIFCPCCAHGVLCHEINGAGYYRNCIVWLLSCITLQAILQSASCLVPPWWVDSAPCAVCAVLWVYASTAPIVCFYGGPVAAVLGTINRTRLREKYGLAGDECEGESYAQGVALDCLWEQCIMCTCTGEAAMHTCSLYAILKRKCTTSACFTCYLHVEPVTATSFRICVTGQVLGASDTLWCDVQTASCTPSATLAPQHRSYDSSSLRVG